MIVKIAAVLFLAAGLFFIAEDILYFPPVSAVKAVDTLTGEKKPVGERIYYPAARFIEPLIHIPEYRKEAMKKDLGYAGLEMTPEFYISLVIIHAAVYALLGIAVLPFIPLGAAALFVYSVFYFFNHLKIKAGDKRRMKIESEIPRFTSYVVQNLPRRQGVVNIIRGYREIAGKELGKELDTLITGLHTKNHETALVEFDSRINSSLMSDLVKGLIGIENGEDMTSYLTDLEIRMNDHEKAKLKKEAAKRPENLNPASWMLFISICLIYASVLFMQLCESLSAFN